MLRVSLPNFEQQRLAVSAPWLGSSKVYLNGRYVPFRKSVATVLDDQGQTVTVSTRRRFPDPFPRLMVNGAPVAFGQAWRFREWAWLYFPLALGALGGLLGLLMGWLAVLINGRVFRSRFSTTFRYMATLLITLAAVSCWLDVFWIVQHHAWRLAKP